MLLGEPKIVVSMAIVNQVLRATRIIRFSRHDLVPEIIVGARERSLDWGVGHGGYSLTHLQISATRLWPGQVRDAKSGHALWSADFSRQYMRHASA